MAGTKYAIKETAQNGANLDNYVTTWECVDAKAGTKLGGGSGATGEVTLPAGQSGKSISCTFTNAAKKPGLDLVKSVTPDGPYKVGDVVTYTFKMTNTGAVPLKDVKPAEKLFNGSASMSAFECPDAAKSLAPSASVSCTAKYTILQGDVDRGTIDNTATASGTDPGGRTVLSKESSAKLVGSPAAAGITLDKVASPKGAEDYKLGQTIKYSFNIKNTGNVTLTKLRVNEGTFTGNGKLQDVSCPDTALAPGASVACTATYTLTQADIDQGSVENTATATGTPPGKDTPPIESNPDTETVKGNPAKSLSIVKGASPSTTESYKLGQKIEYTFTIKNTGDVTLTNVHPNEEKFSGTGTLSNPVCEDGAKSLAPGKSVTCTATYTLTQADIDAGKLENIATATGTPPGNGEPVTSGPDTKTLAGEPKPAISLEKTASLTEADQFKVGETITYTFTMTNTGNVTLKDVHPNEVEFTAGKDKLSAFDCPDRDKPLAPNASAKCTAAYTLTQEDVDRGKLDNTATATGTTLSGDPVKSNEDTVKLSGNKKPDLEIKKTASPKSVETFKVGQEITYTFDIKNTGNQTLTNVKVVEGHFTGFGKITDLSCPDGAKSMLPGATVQCSAKYTITQADVNAGTLDNSATATGTPPGTEKPIESKPSEETLTGDPKPGLTLQKTADPRENVKVGDTVTYTFEIKNTGDQTLTKVHVNDKQFSGSGKLSDISCPKNSLDPSESVTCTATYVFTDKDMKAGKVDNMATATGNQPSGKPVDSNLSEATVTAGEQPGGTGSLGSLGTGSLGSLGVGSLAAGSLAAGSLAAGSLAAGSLDAGSLDAGSLAAGSLDAGSVDAGSLAAGSLGAGSLDAGSVDAGSLAAGSLGAGSLAAGSLAAGSKENSGSAGSTGSGTPGGSNTPGGGTETGNPGTPGNPGNPGNPGTPADSDNGGNGGNAGKSGDTGTTGNSDTGTGAKIDSGLGADSDGGMNAGLVAGGLVLLIAAGGVLLFALRRRNQGNE
ncbi:hypothetical protein P9209_15565 [Prescottella defluvii]|nr:hypothetical protein P9209_15565 [Prescottella defluvii]